MRQVRGRIDMIGVTHGAVCPSCKYLYHELTRKRLASSASLIAAQARMDLYTFQFELKSDKYVLLPESLPWICFHFSLLHTPLNAGFSMRTIKAIAVFP